LVVTEELSPSLLAFIRAHVTSVELLEVLLLLNSQRAVSWDAEGVAAELRIQPRSAMARLDALHRVGLARMESPSYAFDPSNAVLTALVDELAAAYQTRRVTVIETIFAKPADNIRIFADAFVFGRKRKKEKGDD
jgi:hypothetical protein